MPKANGSGQRRKRWLQFLAATGVLSAAMVSGAELTVFAAASLVDALTEIAAPYEKQSGHKLVFNFGASSFLARQIEEGAPADLFFSADEAKMDGLEKRGLIRKETRKSRLSNVLVIAAAADSAIPIRSPTDLAEARVKRIALADPKAVPAGIYAKAFLQKASLWPAVESKIIPTDNVRAALAAVESGNVEAAIVFKTDARISKRVKVVFEVPREDAPGISYPMALIKESRNLEAGRTLLRYLDSNEAAKTFEKHGFIVLK